MNEKIQRKLLLDNQECLKSDFEPKYIEYFFDVPDNVSKVGLKFTYRNEYSETNPNKAVMFISLHDPKGFRGHRMNPGGRGEVILELWVTPNRQVRVPFLAICLRGNGWHRLIFGR